MADIKTLLENSKIIAIVGLSPKEQRPSNQIAKFLKEKGFQIIPINPGQKEILGEKCYKNLESIPKEINIDIVDVFKKSEDTPKIARETANVKPKALWLQFGIRHPESKKIAEEAGLQYIENKCIKIEYQRFFGDNYKKASRR